VVAGFHYGPVPSIGESLEVYFLIFLTLRSLR
jgi:hypothetical protein